MYRRNLLENPNFHVLDETDELIVGHLYDDGCIIRKTTGEELLYEAFYGDPECGLISKDNKWAIVAGHHIAIWRNGKVSRIKEDSVKDVHDMRAKDESLVELLTDPWSDHSAIWILDMESLTLKKVRDFLEYQGSPNRDEVEW